MVELPPLFDRRDGTSGGRVALDGSSSKSRKTNRPRLARYADEPGAPKFGFNHLIFL